VGRIFPSAKRRKKKAELSEILARAVVEILSISVRRVCAEIYLIVCCKSELISIFLTWNSLHWHFSAASQRPERWLFTQLLILNE
jgi:hypothetical protein